MSAPPIRLLLVEDDKVDRIACRRVLMADPDHAFEVIEAETGQEGLDLALSMRPDCILLDYHLPDVTGLEFLTRLGAGAGAASVPVMMLTGADSAAVAAESMRRGARDYLLKDSDGRYLQLLPAAVHRMLREQKLLREKRQIEARLRTLVEQIQAIIYIAAPASGNTLQYVSPQIAMLGFSPAEWLSDRELHARQLHPDDRAGVLAAIGASRLDGTPLLLEYRLLARDGSVLWFRDEAKVVADEGGTPFIQGLLVDITRNKLAEQALESSQDELRKLSAHQETIKERERTRIAQEVHDELGGLLTGINAYISVAIERCELAGGVPDPLLVEACKLVKNAMETVRKVITDLRPSVLDQLGIWAALEWYMEQVGQRSGLQCAFRMDPRVAALELGPECSTMLFRIAQEALTNVERHADAAMLSMSLERDGHCLTMRVHDNGKGIDSTRLKGQQSWGIRGMSERARHFHGEVHITGSAETGTTLLLTIPLEQDHDRPND